MKRWTIFLTIASMFALAACGGGGGGGGAGGGGGGGGLQYVGLQAPVAFTSGNYQGVSSTFLDYQSPSDFMVGNLSTSASGSLASTKVATQLMAKITSSIRIGIRRNVSVRATETYPGDISGTVTYSGTEPVLGSPYSFTMTCVNYADTFDTGGATVNGDVFVSGIETIIGTAYSLDDTYTYDDFSIVFPGPPALSVVADGDCRYRVVGSNAIAGGGGWVSYTLVSERLTYGSMTLLVNNKYLKVENYDLYAYSGGITINGNVYYSDYGLVFVETLTPITSWSGTVHLHGTNGTAVRLVFGSGSCTASLEIGDDAPPAFDDGSVMITL